MSDQEAGKEVIDVRFGCTSLSSGKNLNSYHLSIKLILIYLFFFLIELGAELNEFVTTDVIDDVFSFIERRVVNEEFWEINIEENEDEYENLEEDRFSELDSELLADVSDIKEIRDIQEKILPELQEKENSDSEWLK